MGRNPLWLSRLYNSKKKPKTRYHFARGGNPKVVPKEDSSKINWLWKRQVRKRKSSVHLTQKNKKNMKRRRSSRLQELIKDVHLFMNHTDSLTLSEYFDIEMRIHLTKHFKYPHICLTKLIDPVNQQTFSRKRIGKSLYRSIYSEQY